MIELKWDSKDGSGGLPISVSWSADHDGTVRPVTLTIGPSDRTKEEAWETIVDLKSTEVRALIEFLKFSLTVPYTDDDS